MFFKRILLVDLIDPVSTKEKSKHHWIVVVGCKKENQVIGRVNWKAHSLRATSFLKLRLRSKNFTIIFWKNRSSQSYITTWLRRHETWRDHVGEPTVRSGFCLRRLRTWRGRKSLDQVNLRWLIYLSATRRSGAVTLRAYLPPSLEIDQSIIHQSDNLLRLHTLYVTLLEKKPLQQKDNPTVIYANSGPRTCPIILSYLLIPTISSYSATPSDSFVTRSQLILYLCAA